MTTKYPPAELDAEVRTLHKCERRLINLLRQVPFGSISITMVGGFPEFVTLVEEKIKLSD